MYSQPQTPFQDEFAGEHLAFVLGKEQQQVVFLGLERQHLPIQEDFAAGQIDDQVVERQVLLRGGRCLPFPAFLHFITDESGPGAAAP